MKKYITWWVVVCIEGFGLFYILGWVLMDMFEVDIKRVAELKVGILFLTVTLVIITIWLVKMYGYFKKAAWLFGKRPSIKPETLKKMIRLWGFVVAWVLGMAVELVVFGWFEYYFAASR